MKKIVSTLLVSSLLATAIVPINNVSAKENKNENISLSTTETINQDLSNVEFNPIVDNEKVSSVEVAYGDGKTSLAEYNKESGEILFDGKLVALVEEVPSSNITEESLITKDNTASTLSSSAKYYTIGTPGSGIHSFQYSRNFKFTVVAGASVVAIAASLATFYLEKKPNIQSAALIAAAAQILVLTATGYTYNIKYSHYKDAYKAYYYKDILAIYKGSISSSNLKIQISHYYGKV